MKKNMRVRKALFENGVTHAELASLLGISQPTLSMALSVFELASSEQSRLVKMIKDGGVSNYSIYWDKDTNILFGYQECVGEGSSQDTDNVDPITQKWWDMMADIMEVNPDNSPVTIPIQDVFHLD